MLKKFCFVSFLVLSSFIGISAEAVPLPSDTAQSASDLQPDPSLALSSAPREKSADESLNLAYVKGYFTDTKQMVTAPLQWDLKDWTKAGIVLGVTSGLFLVDQKAKDFAQSHQSPVASKFATVGNDLGNALYTLPPLAGFYLYGHFADDSKARKTSLLALESFTITAAMNTGLKVLVQRHRPSTGDSPGTLDGPRLSLKNLSFCSGHTSSAFSLATVFADQYKDHPFVPPIAYGLATLTGLSRIYSNAHWSSDAFFGAALGYFISKGVLSLHREDKTKPFNRLVLMPAFSKEMTGFNMSYDF